MCPQVHEREQWIRAAPPAGARKDAETEAATHEISRLISTREVDIVRMVQAALRNKAIRQAQASVKAREGAPAQHL